MPDKPVGLSEEEKWESMMRSIRKAAKILKIDLTERDIPEYLNWTEGSRLHDDLWDRVYGRARMKKEETHEERMKRQAEQLRRGEELLAAGRKSLEEGQKLLGESNPDPQHNLRIQLIQLKTDMEREAPDLESIFRGAIEETIKAASGCDIMKVFDSYAFSHEIGNAIEKRVGLKFVAKMGTIDQLTRKVIVQELVKNCDCDFPIKVYGEGGVESSEEYPEETISGNGGGLE